MAVRFEPKIDRAIEVLRDFGGKINAPKILKLLPDSTDLSALSDFIEVIVSSSYCISLRW